MTVLAATSWKDNASLIADAVVPLGYIKPEDRVIDVTYGRGLWWKKYQHPEERFLGLRNEDNYDYRDLHFNPPGTWDVVVFDPPYVSMGGRKTSTLPDFMDRCGLEGAARTPQLLFDDNMRGLRECQRICKPGGLILHKTCNYVSSGRLMPQVHWTFTYAKLAGLELVDEFTMVGHSRAQPPGRRQVHARNNTSTLFVFRAPRRSK